MTALKDALTNLDPEMATDPTYAKGVLVGAVAALIHARGYTFDDALEEVSRHLPPVLLLDAIPMDWEAVTGLWTTT